MAARVSTRFSNLNRLAQNFGERTHPRVWWPASGKHDRWLAQIEFEDTDKVNHSPREDHTVCPRDAVTFDGSISLRVIPWLHGSRSRLRRGRCRSRLENRSLHRRRKAFREEVRRAFAEL
jgi:hypothetical protein